jgi:hypothetical protein
LRCGGCGGCERGEEEGIGGELEPGLECNSERDGGGDDGGGWVAHGSRHERSKCHGCRRKGENGKSMPGRSTEESGAITG